MTTRVALDESGYTGPDLINPVQPNFIVASTIMSDHQADQIIQDSLPPTQAPEYKFKNIWKSDKHRNALPNFCAEVAKEADEIFVWKIQKRFALFVKMIDYLIEPVFYHAGYNFYAPWYAQSYCNTIYRDITNRGRNLAIYNNLTTIWNRFARYPNEDNLNSLSEFLKREAPHYAQPIPKILSQLLEGVSFFKRRGALENFENTNEIQFTSVLASISYWAREGYRPMEVAHDQSNNFFAHADLWKTITSAEQPAAVYTLGNATQLEFPLGVTKTEAVDSKSSPAIQISDIISGLVAKFSNANDAGELSALMKDCLSAGLGNLQMSGSAPGERYVNRPPPKLSGPDSLDQFSGILFPESKGLNL